MILNHVHSVVQTYPTVDISEPAIVKIIFHGIEILDRRFVM